MVSSQEFTSVFECLTLRSPELWIWNHWKSGSRNHGLGRGPPPFLGVTNPVRRPRLLDARWGLGFPWRFDASVQRKISASAGVWYVQEIFSGHTWTAECQFNCAFFFTKNALFTVFAMKMVSISRIVLNIRCQRVGALSDSVAKFPSFTNEIRPDFFFGVRSKQVLNIPEKVPTFWTVPVTRPIFFPIKDGCFYTPLHPAASFSSVHSHFVISNLLWLHSPKHLKHMDETLRQPILG